MADFIIKAIEENFNPLFELDDPALQAQGAVKLTVDEYPGFPCRISLEDAPLGEEVLLLPYKHHQTASPYQTSGPIFIRKNVQHAKLKTNEVPPNLQLMVSEEPRSEIYSHATYTGAKVDIWLPVLNNYDPDISWERETNNSEETWIYFLHGTTPPYFNPITLDHQGIESKLTGWFL